MYYSNEIVDEVRIKNDIVDVISPYVRLTRRGSNYFGLCPFHGEKTPSFSVNRDRQVFHCFGCGEGGNSISFVMKYENLTFAEAVERLADKAGVELPSGQNGSEAKRRADIRTKLFEIYKEAAKFYYFQLRSDYGGFAMQYLKDRGLTDKTMSDFGLGYSLKSANALYSYLKSKGYSDELMIKAELVTFREDKGIFDMFWNRVIFPIMDQNSKVIAFGGRVMGDGQPKYLNSRETDIFNKRRNLYGLNFAKHSKESYILLCEGYMDVIALHQAGFTNAAASLGTALTEEQARLIARYVKDVVITYDSDGAGVKAALRAIPILKSAGIRTRILNLIPYKDPDELIKAEGRDEFKKRVENSMSSFNFELINIEKSFNLSEPESKTEFFNRVAERLTEFEEELERENYITAVSEKYFISKEALRKLVNKIGGVKEIKDVIKAADEKIKREGRLETANEGRLRTNRLLLGFIADRPEYYKRIKNIIPADYFITSLYKDVAKRIFAQIEEGRKPDAAEIISRYESGEDQAKVAAIFEEKLETEIDNNELERAFKEVVIKVRKAGLETLLDKATEEGDLKLFGEITAKQGELKRLDF